MNLEQLRNDLQSLDISDLTSWPLWFRWIGILVIGIVILVFGHRYGVAPEQRALVEITAQESTLKQTYQEKSRRAAQLPLYAKQVADIQDRFGIVLHQLPDTTEMHTLLLDISQVGRESGLTMHTFTPGPATDEAFYKTLPISISVSGSFNQLAEFIIGLSSLPRIVHVSDMRIERGEEAQLLMEAELFTYQYLEPEPEAEAEADAPS